MLPAESDGAQEQAANEYVEGLIERASSAGATSLKERADVPLGGTEPMTID